MRRPARATLLSATVAIAVALTGCGLSTTGYERAGAPAAGIREPGTQSYTARLYFLSPVGMRGVSRPADGPVGPQQALDLLLEGPTPAERTRGLVTQVPPMHGRLQASARAGGVDIRLPLEVRLLPIAAVSQLTCTAANAALPGTARPYTDIDIRLYEPNAGNTPFTLRCAPTGDAYPATTSG